MQQRSWLWSIALCALGCTPATPSFPSLVKSDAGTRAAAGTGGAAGTGARFDAGVTNTGPRCPAGLNLCDLTCCPSGTTCVAGACQYPYSSAHLYVYLCPSFNNGCNASFFALDQMCSPIKSAQPGTCYDTGFEVAANKSYGMASCQMCGSGCGGPASFKTPAGFTEQNYYSGVTWFCNTKCEAPLDCGGRASSSDAGVGAGAARCSSMDCWLDALSVRQNGESVPLVMVQQPSPPTSSSASNPGQTPEITRVNGTTVSSSTTVTLTAVRRTTDETQLSYDFSDPTGCAPGLCFSLPHCPKGVQCSAGTTTACTRPKPDGARAGSVMLSLGFKAEPADPTTAPELPLQIQPIVGPADAASGNCGNPFDESNPTAPGFLPTALVGDPVELDATVIGSRAPGGIDPGGGTAGNGGTAGSSSGTGGTAGVDCACHCEDGRVCSASSGCGVDSNGIPNVCGCPVGPPCH